MLGLKIFVRVQTFRQRPFVPSHNFCHPAQRYISSRITNPLKHRANQSQLGCVGSYAREDQGQRAGKQSAREDSVGGRRPWKIMLDSKVFTIRIRDYSALKKASF